MPVGLLGFSEEFGDVRLLGDIGLNGNGLAAALGDGGDDLVRARFAGGVINYDGRAFCREMCGDGRADAFGCAGDDCDFAGEFLGDVRTYVRFLSISVLWFVRIVCYSKSNKFR